MHLFRLKWSFYYKYLGENVCVKRNMEKELDTGRLQYKIGKEVTDKRCNINNSGMQLCISHF